MSEFFRRVEKKYVITKEQYLFIKKEISDRMIEDEHGKSTICNIYFDTQDYELIRNSIEKPIYKDKIRLRSYNIPVMNEHVYLEIKKKCEGVVSKRRIRIELKDFYKYIIRRRKSEEENQVLKEIRYYFEFYQLRPTMFLSYIRTAYYEKENKNFRITFDNNIIARTYDLELQSGNYGRKIFEDNKYIMEIKTLGAMPIWFINILNKMKIFPCGFSKYGEAYTQLILKANNVAEYIM
jgi:SPX domain protein involved in polyphosphate accumulation